MFGGWRAVRDKAQVRVRGIDHKRKGSFQRMEIALETAAMARNMNSRITLVVLLHAP